MTWPGRQADQPINDRKQNILEQACQARRAVRVELADGRVLTGTAVDTRHDGRDAFLVLESPGRERLVRLSAVAALAMLEP